MFATAETASFGKQLLIMSAPKITAGFLLPARSAAASLIAFSATPQLELSSAIDNLASVVVKESAPVPSGLQPVSMRTFARAVSSATSPPGLYVR